MFNLDGAMKKAQEAFGDAKKAVDSTKKVANEAKAAFEKAANETTAKINEAKAEANKNRKDKESKSNDSNTNTEADSAGSKKTSAQRKTRSKRGAKASADSKNSTKTNAKAKEEKAVSQLTNGESAKSHSLFSHLVNIFAIIGVISVITLPFRGCSSQSAEVPADTTEAATTEVVTPEAATIEAVTPELEDLEVVFIDVGQGDATLVKLPDGQVMLVDAGPDIEAKAVETVLENKGIKTIDYAVITHGDTDHITGMPEILDSYEVDEFYAPKVTQSTDSYINLLEKVQEKGINAHAAWKGDVIVEGDGFSVEVLSPEDGQTFDDSNDWSAVLLLAYKDTKILLTGDAPKEVLKNLELSDVDLLKVAHHGSDTGTDTELVEKLQPTDAVISYALVNEYGHPTQSVLDALIGVRVYGTGANGNITATSDGLSIVVKTEKEGTVSAPITETEAQAEEEAAAEAAAAEAAAAEAAAQAQAESEAAAAESQAEQPTQSEVTVVVTPTGAKYHHRGCRTLSRSKTLTELTISEAEARGYDPCGVCM